MRQKGDLKVVLLLWRPTVILIYFSVESHLREVFHYG